MANTFVELNDTPSVYTGAVGKFVQVSGTDTLIFNSVNTNTLTDVETTGAYTPSTNQVLTYTSSGVWRPVTNDPYSVSNGLSKSGSTLNVVAGVGGGLTSNINGLFITPITGVSGVYGNTTHVPQIVVNNKGQITAIDVVEGSFSVAETLNASYIGTLTGTSGQIVVTGGSGQNASATVNLVSTGVTSGTYGNSTHSPQITVDTYGRIQNIDLIEIDGNITVGIGNGNIALEQITTAAYKDIIVAGQTTLSADDPADALTIVAGTGITITTTASSDTLTISATGEVSANLALSTISDLSDVDASGVTNGQALVWDNANNIFVPGTVTSDLSTNSVDDLSDVSITGITNGQVLIWDSANTTFSPGTITATGITSIDDLSDVDISGGVSIGQILVWNGLRFVPGSNNGGSSGDLANSSIGDLGDVNSTGITDGQSLIWDNANSTFVPGVTVSSVDDLSDVSIAGVSDGQTLLWNSANSQFEPGTVSSGGGSAAGERFRINYAADGTLSSTQDLTSGISNVTIDSPTGGEVTITFDNTIYNFPPSGILMYGYDYTNNKYVITPFDTTMTLREVAAGGTSGSPTLFNGTSTITIRLRIRESETGASRGTFGTTSHAYVQFVMNG